jgi:hypothetical protein
MLSILFALLPLLPLGAVATPEILERNLVFRSPYLNEDILKRDTHAIHRRHLAARDEIDTRRRKRAAPVQTAKPDGSPSTYTFSGYGAGVADWDESTYIYAGDLNYTHGVASGMY